VLSSFSVFALGFKACFTPMLALEEERQVSNESHFKMSAVLDPPSWIILDLKIFPKIADRLQTDSKNTINEKFSNNPKSLS